MSEDLYVRTETGSDETIAPAGGETEIIFTDDLYVFTPPQEIYVVTD